MTSLAPWRQVLARSLHRNRALIYARYFQLATIRTDGRPANRTVVFRGFLPESNQIAIITDCRSQKISQIEQNAEAEICWYFPKTREQFRLGGTLYVVDAGHLNASWQSAYNKTWQTLSQAARAQFYGVAPGQPCSSEPLETEPKTDSDSIPASFRLLVFEPKDLDYLDLKTHPHNHRRHWLDQDGAWQTESLTP
jgi:pyridoxamine 5'-phosphate oxidase